MLTEQELVDLCQKHQLGEFARATVQEVRRSQPSRVVRSGTHNVVTHYASRKMGCVIKAEARATELAAIYEWDHDRTTHEFYDQPPRIKKIHDRGDGRTRATSYTPDFFVLADDFVGWVECKAEGWLVEHAQAPDPQYVRDQNGTWRCPSAETYAKSVGLGFAVRSSLESDPIVTQNIADLSDYYRADCPRASGEQILQAQQLMGDAGWCWLRDLIANEVGLGVDAIYKMVVDEQLHLDLSAFSLMREPHRVRVFRTKALMDSSGLWLPPLLESPQNRMSLVSLAPGSAITWDGSAAEIINVGKAEVYLRRAEGTVQTLSLESFEQMVRDGLILGQAKAADPRAEQAAECLRVASSEDMRSAMHRYYCLHPELCPPDEPAHKASDRAIRKWKAMAHEGYAKYGNEFIGLLPNVRLRGNRSRRFDPKAVEIMHEVIETEVLAKSAPGKFSSFSIVTVRCKEAGVAGPCKKSFYAEIKKISTPEARKKAREGEKAGYDLELPYISLERETPRHGTREFDVVHIDHTEMDLQFVSEATGTNMGKAWLTVMIDAVTRLILAWVIMFNAPSYRSCMLVIRDCVRRHGRIPRTIVVDQGSEFKGIYFEQLLAYLGIHKRMRPASHPRFGSIVERFFGLSNSAFVHVLRGNNKALQSPRRMSPTHDPRKLAVWNLRAFREAFESFLNTVYHVVEHPALGVSPSQAQEISRLQAGARSHMLISYNREFLIATMPTTDKGTSKIQPDGSFKANRIDYFSDKLIGFAGQELAVRYDPYDLSRAYAMGRSGWIEAYSMYAGELVGRSEKEIAAISQEIDCMNSRTGIREKDRAAALGNYLVGMREQEAVMAIAVQQARDRELRNADQNVGLIAAALHGSDGDAPTESVSPPEGSVHTATFSFANITQQVLEDF